MKTIEQIFFERNTVAVDAPCLFGVELELEGIDKRFDTPRQWRAEGDGSLRDNGVEFVMRQPMTVLDCHKALRDLKAEFDNKRIRPKLTNLASSHIHIDVRNMTVPQLLDFVALLMIVEKDLAISSGPDRYQNYFALGTTESDHRQRELIDVRTDKDFARFINKIRMGDYRYAGINFESIRRYGSLEIRYLGAQPEVTTVTPWLKFYKNLKELAMKGVDFHRIFESVSIDGLDYVQQLLKPHFPLVAGNVLEGIRNAQDFVFKLEYRFLPAPENGDGLNDFYRR